MAEYLKMTEFLEDELKEFPEITYSVEHEIKLGVHLFFVNLYVNEQFKSRLRFTICDNYFQILFNQNWININPFDSSIKYFWIALLS